MNERSRLEITLQFNFRSLLKKYNKEIQTVVKVIKKGTKKESIFLNSEPQLCS